VTAGDEEYGIEQTGDDADNPGTDLGIPTTPNTLDIMDSAAPADTTRLAVIYKAAIDSVTAAGQYTHDTTYICTGNF